MRFEADENFYRYVLNTPMLAKDPSGLAFSVDSSCNFCVKTSPVEPGWDLGERIRSEASTVCAMLSRIITDPKLRKCVGKSCDTGTVKCRDGCDPARIAEAQQTSKWSPFADRTVTVCRNTAPRAASLPGYLGLAVIHEFAHGCSWGHGEGKGVPLDPGPDQPK